MRTQGWLVFVMILTGCPLLETPSDGGISNSDEGSNSACGDGGQCVDGDKRARLPGALASGSSDDAGEPRGSDPNSGLDAGAAPSIDPTSGGDATAFIAAREDLNRSICACSGLSFDQCTETTPEQRTCESANLEAHAAEAGAWLACVTEYLHQQAECVRAAACQVEQLSACDIVAQADGGDPLSARCGDAPVVLDESVSTCMSEASFPCSSGEEVPAAALCDGVQDCSDNSDESACQGGDTFACGDGSSVPASWVCDGTADCSTGADEVDCASGEFDCGDGVIIPSDWVCDAEADCANGSDETSCDSSAN